MNIYVGNISWGLTDQDLENVFAEYVTVTSAKLLQTGQLVVQEALVLLK